MLHCSAYPRQGRRTFQSLSQPSSRLCQAWGGGGPSQTQGFAWLLTCAARSFRPAYIVERCLSMPGHCPCFRGLLSFGMRGIDVRIVGKSEFWVRLPGARGGAEACDSHGAFGPLALLRLINKGGLSTGLLGKFVWVGGGPCVKQKACPAGSPMGCTPWCIRPRLVPHGWAATIRTLSGEQSSGAAGNLIRGWSTAYFWC